MPKDYLTSLPAELFDYICDLVVIAKPKQYLGGISKAFLPSARERTFWSVHIYKEPAAIRFVEALAASPGAASHVRYLTLHLPETAFSSEAAAPVLRRAISHLRNVRQICLTVALQAGSLLSRRGTTTPSDTTFDCTPWTYTSFEARLRVAAVGCRKLSASQCLHPLAGSH
ncbi:RHTO0S22e01750g1_1 [Rhodotorula toruloides]|uniref:RHTO0S22e01750g1_1 n=1 Tax=Rhodotorula toruloides TaxID=5286 RepID=A0A061BGC1_RHOTO|nr:RHTO0S22e01750g1_1 [Rhodotorula toruloides]